MIKKAERETLAQLTATPSYTSDIVCLYLLPTCSMTLTVHHSVNTRIFQGSSPCFCRHLFPPEAGNWWGLLSVWGLHKILSI